MSIKKIAKIAGVSPATVSRVLNIPNYKCSSPGLRNKIWKIAMEMNYAPNEAARNLKKGKSNASKKTYYIHILITKMNKAEVDPFHTELLRVIESEIHKNLCILSNVAYIPFFSINRKARNTDWNSIIKNVCEEAGEKSDGLIIIGKCNKEAIACLQSYYQNIVSVNRNFTEFETDEITCDGHRIASIAMDYLIKLGHHEIGYVGDCHKDARYKGYLDTLKKHDIEVDLDYIIETGQTEKEGYECIEHLLQSDNCPTGIYCANDITAVGMLKWIQKNGNRYFVPSIISSDDIEYAQDTRPMLTTVSLPKEEMGKFALFVLLDRIKGGHTDKVRMEFEGKLMIRESCTPVDEVNWNDYSI